MTSSSQRQTCWNCDARVSLGLDGFYHCECGASGSPVGVEARPWVAAAAAREKVASQLAGLRDYVRLLAQLDASPAQVAESLALCVDDARRRVLEGE